MPAIKVEIDKNGRASMNYEGFVGEECNVAEGQIIEKLKSLKMQNIGETKHRFEDRKMEMENR